MHRPVRALLVLVALAAPSLASIASPPSGTQFGLSLGGVVNVKLKNANGCTFDLLAEAADPGIVSLSRTMGTGLTKETVAIEAIGVGSTMVTITTLGGTCPPAVHTYQVDVTADWKALSKDFDQLARSQFKEFKVDVGLAYKGYASELSTLNVQYKDGTLDDDGLFEGFHGAAVDLRKAWTLSASLHYADVLAGGGQILDDAAATFGEAPDGFFAGGCGSFDWFQDSVCSRAADFHDAFDKASKKGVKAFAKSGAPVFGQWCTLPPLFSAGPLYPVQVADFPLPQALTGPLTISTLPARNVAGDDGRVLVSGLGLASLSGQLEVSLSYFADGQAPVVLMQMPDIVDGQWTADFSGLTPGAWLMATRYAGDEAAVEVPIGVLRTQFSF